MQYELAMPENELAIMLRRLSERYDHFYHFTTDQCLPSIRQRGIDPAFEDPRSHYARRANEPETAMRFFTLDQPGIEVGRSAAVARTQEFIDGIWQQGNSKAACFASDPNHCSSEISASIIHLEMRCRLTNQAPRSSFAMFGRPASSPRTMSYPRLK